MRGRGALIFSLFVSFLFPVFTNAGTPVCVKRPEAHAKLNLRTPAGKTGKKRTPAGKKRKPAGKKRKPAGKNKSKKNAVKVKEETIKLSQYTPLTWTGKKESGWLEVRSMDGHNYWVRRRDLSFNLKCLSVQVKQSRLRTGPGSQFERAPVAQKGDVFLDLGGEDGWTQVENSKGEKAWINLDHTWRPTTKMRMVFEPEK